MPTADRRGKASPREMARLRNRHDLSQDSGRRDEGGDAGRRQRYREARGRERHGIEHARRFETAAAFRTDQLDARRSRPERNLDQLLAWSGIQRDNDNLRSDEIRRGKDRGIATDCLDPH